MLCISLRYGKLGYISIAHFGGENAHLSRRPTRFPLTLRVITWSLHLFFVSISSSCTLFIGNFHHLFVWFNYLLSSFLFWLAKYSFAVCDCHLTRWLQVSVSICPWLPFPWEEMGGVCWLACYSLPFCIFESIYSLSLSLSLDFRLRTLPGRRSSSSSAELLPSASCKWREAERPSSRVRSAPATIDDTQWKGNKKKRFSRDYKN